MFAWIRRRLSAVTTALLLSMATLGVPHGLEPGHDADFAAIVVQHDASAHQFRTPEGDAPSHPLHCVVCHWARTFRPTITATYLSSPTLDVLVAWVAGETALPHHLTASQPPLRSPPTALFV